MEKHSYIRMEVLQPLNAKLELGVGFNWFDFFGSGGSYGRHVDYKLEEKLYPDSDDEQSWNSILKALDDLKPGFIRFGLPPDPHIDQNGNFFSNTVHMENLIRLDAWAQKNGCTLLLDTFVIPSYFEQALPNLEGWTQICCNMAPNDNDKYAQRFIAKLLDYVVNQKAMHSIKYFNPVNEPMEYGVFISRDGNTAWQYVDMYRAIRQAMDTVGITRDRMKLICLDGSMHALKPKIYDILDCGINLNQYVDAYSIHYYKIALDHLQSPYPMKQVIETETRGLTEFFHSKNKPLFACEVGTFHYGWREQDPMGPSYAEACLTVSEAVIRAMKLGVGGFAFWSFMNTDRVDGQWSIIRLHDKELEKSMYPYHFYGLLSKHARPDSTIYPLESNENEQVHIHGVMLQSPDESRSVFLVNDSPDHCKTVKLCLGIELETKAWEAVSTDRVRLMQSLPVSWDRETGELELRLNPMSLTVIHSNAI